MDISAIVFLSCIGLNVACFVYVISQGAKAVIWVIKVMKDDDKEI